MEEKMNDLDLMKQLLFTGKIERITTIQEMAFKYRNLTAKEQYDAEVEISGIKGSMNSIAHTYYMIILSKSLISADTKIFASSEETKTWLENQSTVLVYKLMELQRKLEKDIVALVGGLDKEKIEDFTKTPE